MVAPGVNLASGKNLENQKEQGVTGKIARKPFAGLENTLAAPGKANANANKDGFGPDVLICYAIMPLYDMDANTT